MDEPTRIKLRDAPRNARRLYALLATANAGDVGDPAPGSPLAEALLPLLFLMPEHAAPTKVCKQ